jgi:hypothetical protein
MKLPKYKGVQPNKFHMCFSGHNGPRSDAQKVYSAREACDRFIPAYNVLYCNINVPFFLVLSLI